MSASLWQVKITNISQCVNLKNLYSEYNTYTKQDIEPLSNLKRIYSCDDNYQNEGSCFIEDLFTRNKPEYVCVESNYENRNILRSMVLSQNISDLRYMYIMQQCVTYNIKLDVSNEQPEHLSIYDIDTYSSGGHRYGVLEGPLAAVEKVKDGLIHELKQNQ